MRFIDREQEMARLVRLGRERNGGFVAIWGRRRIGKSELLKEWCRRLGGVYTVADQSSSAVQRAAFAIALSERFAGFADVTYPSWKSLFEALSRQAKAQDWHGPLAMDEFPYWVEADDAMPSVLQNWVDDEKRRGGIVCAIAGSVQHMMQGLVLDSDSPLYGRVDEKIKLPPIDVGHIKEALSLRSAMDAVKAYAVWGGVPRYWVAAERFGNNLDAAIDELVLDPIGLFHEEPTTLLQSEIPSAISLKPYLDVIGLGANRVSEIAARLGVAATAMSRPLARLIEIGLVKKELPFGESEKSSKKSLYKVSDPFCRFWFSVMAGRRSVFDMAPAKVRMNIWRNCREHVFATEWEELARSVVVKHDGLAELAGECGYWLPSGRWWQGELPEWDVVSANGDGTRLLLGEVKWSEKPFSGKAIKDLVRRLKMRKIPVGLSGAVQYVLFLSSVEPKSLCSNSFDGVKILTAEDVCFRKFNTGALRHGGSEA